MTKEERIKNIVGSKVGSLHVDSYNLEESKVRKRTMMQCTCDCGNVEFVDIYDLEHKRKIRCKDCTKKIIKNRTGTNNPAFKDQTGNVIFHYKILSLNHFDNEKHTSFWDCVDLESGNTCVKSLDELHLEDFRNRERSFNVKTGVSKPFIFVNETVAKNILKNLNKGNKNK